MKIALSLIGVALISLALFATYRMGIQKGRSEGVSIAVAVAEGARYEATKKIGLRVGNPELWEGMSREQFQERMSGESRNHFTRLHSAFRGLEAWQREAVISALWESLSEEDEGVLRRTPLPSSG